MSVRVAINPTLAELSDGRTDWIVESASSVRAAIEAAFSTEPRLIRGLIDEQGLLRRHIAVFCDGQRLAISKALETAVDGDVEIVIMTAVSGG